MKPKKLSRDDVAKIVRHAIDEAIDFIDSDIEPKHSKAAKYYAGKCNVPHEAERSGVVATKCRDEVRKVKPSLLRVFMSTARPVEFIPKGAEDVAAAEQQTAYVQYAFNEAQGYKVLYSAFHDALVKAPGIIKAWWDEREETHIEDYSSLPDEQFVAMASDDDATVLEHEAREEMVDGPQGPVPVTVHDCKIAWKDTSGKLALRPIPPEDFFVDSNATCIEDAYICGHKSEMRTGDLVSMGFKWADVEDLGTDDNEDDVETDRRGFTPEDKKDNGDPAMKPVTVYEAYMKMDIEGAGIPRLYAFIVAGKAKKLLSYELCSVAPFAIFEIDPEPHAFFGHSLVDLLIQDQDAATSMLRGTIDNVHMSNNPRIAADENGVNVDDLLNNEIGAVIRTKGTPGDKLTPVSVPFVAGSTLPALQYFDGLIEAKTGISRASLGLNPDALQSTTAAAVNATVSGADGQIEVMARNLAEGGMKRLFRIILGIVQTRVSPGEFMRLDGRFIPVDPQTWNAGMDLIVNVGLGTNRREEKAMALAQTLQTQLMLQQAGSPLVSQTLIRNTLADILDAGGIHNADRYYMPMDQQTEQQLQQQAAQAAQQQPDPNAQVIQAQMQIETQKAQGRMAEAEMKTAADMQKAAAQNDLDRDRMEQDAVLKLIEMGQQNARAEASEIRALQAVPRA